MKTPCIILLAGCTSLAWAQLAPPPGPVQPTMKSLEQVEPRIPLTQATTPGDAQSTFIIDQPGSYYLTGNLENEPGVAHAITIAADDVTVDLKGFGVYGVPGSDAGIRNQGARTGIVIRGGHVSGWGGDGIDLNHQDVPCLGSRVEDVFLIDNDGHGVDGGTSCSVESSMAMLNGGIGFRLLAGGHALDCRAQFNNSDGINVIHQATIIRCVAEGNDSRGIVTGASSIVQSCVSEENGSVGMYLSAHNAVTDCTARSNDGTGFFVSFKSTVAGCTSTDNGNDGFALNDGAVISRSVSTNNSGNGFFAAFGAGIDRCSSIGNEGVGIWVRGQARVTHNHVDGNGTAQGLPGVLANLEGSNHIEGNTVSGSLRGYDIDSTHNVIIRNIATGNSIDFDIAANNVVGVISQAPLSPSIIGSSGGAGVGTTRPWANIAIK